MKSGKLLIFLAMLALALGVLTATAYAAPSGPDTDPRAAIPEKPPRPETPAAALGTAPAGAGITRIDASTVNSVSPTMLPPGTPFDLCFNVTISSPDTEYLDRLDVNLPDGWTVNSLADVPGTGCGYGHTSGVEAGNVIYWQTNGYPPPSGCGDWSNGTYNFCANVTVPSCSGAPWSFPWNIIGDGYGNPPHSTAGTAGPVECLQPGVYLTPETATAEGCNGEPQVHTFTVLNNAGYDTTVNLAYSILAGAGSCTGPASVAVPNGGTSFFDVILTPVGVPSDTVICQITAVDAANPNNTDTSLIVKHLIAWYWDPGGWQLEPIANATPNQWSGGVVGTNPAAAGPVGYVVGGLAAGSSIINPDLQMYDPGTGTWTQLADLPNPRFSPAVGWIGGLLYAAGGYDTAFAATNDLQVYNPATNTWDNTTPPDMPNARGGGGGGVGTCASGSGECLFHVGGGPDGQFANTTLETWQYDPGTAAWTQLDNKPAGSSPNGVILGAGVGCLGNVYVGGDYRGYHEFYRLDATQPAGSQWTQLANIPAAAGAMTPALVCKEDVGAIVLIGGDPDGFWGTYNTTVYVYNIAADTWNAPLPQTLNVGQLGSVGWHMYGKVWTAGGTIGSGAISPMPHESLAQIQCPVQQYEWAKYINGQPWTPGIQVTVQTSDTIQVTEIVTTNLPFNLVENWNPAHLRLLDFEVSPGGMVITGTGYLEWHQPPGGPGPWYIIKWFHVEPCDWTSTLLDEVLFVSDLPPEPRPVLINKLPPLLWINALYQPPVTAGLPANFTLRFGNDGGYENNVMIRNDFPPEAPFMDSIPPPSRVGAGGLWVEWDLGDLPQGAQGNIDVEVMIQPGVPPSTTISIVDIIFDHIRVERARVIITFHVVPPPIVWDKTIDGVPWQPGMEITRQTSDTIVVQEVLHLTPPPLAGSMPFVPVDVEGQGGKTSLTLSSPARPLGTPEAPAHPETILWDQPLSTVNQNAYVDQDFSDLPAYSSFLADDFVNPNPWSITTIFVPGDGWNGFTSLFNATALTWQIYADNAGVPDGNPSGGGNPPVWTLTLLPTDPQVTITTGTPGGYPSNTTLNLATPLTLPVGHWWLVFYPTLSFGSYGQYGRQPADTTNGYTGQFINPGGGFGYGTVWQNWTVLGGTQPDIAFRLEGPCCFPPPIFAQIETWDPTRLHLLDWAATGGQVILDPTGRLEWTGELIEPTTITLTKWFHVEPCTWTQTVLWEELWLDQVELEQRPVVIHKVPPVLWIDAGYQPGVQPGFPANFSLSYGNTGGFDNDVWVRNNFPPEAPFVNSVPPATNVDPNGLWAEWYVGGLPQGAMGNIDVTVQIMPTLPPSTTIEIWDGIFDHTGELRDWVIITFHVEPPPIVWDKTIDGVPWQPGMEITRQTSDTIEVVEVIHIVPPPPLAMGDPKPVTPQANADTAPTSRAPIGTLALGGLLFEIDFGAVTADTQLLGVEFDGTYYWVTGGNSNLDPNKLYKLDTAGNLVATYDQASDAGWGWRDLAFDGTYLYSSDSALVEQIDPATGLATGVTIPSPINPARALAYDPATDHFWTANWDSIIYEFDRTGTVINAFPAVGLSTYGMAWESWSPGGPFLWLWSQDGPDPLLMASQVNPTTGALTGVSFLGSGVAGEMAGGAAISAQVVPGQVVFLGMNQGVSDRLGVYDLGITLVPPPVFAQIETWDPTRLHLVNWAATGGEVIVEPNRVVWTGELIEPATITLTKWFHVEPCTWTLTTLWEELWLDQVELEQRPVVIHKVPPVLWIDAVGGGDVFPGQPANFTLLFGNQGGFENDVLIRNEFPPTAPFVGSVPPPTSFDPAGAWAEWNFTGLAQGQQGTIDVTVMIQPTVPPSTTITIVDYISDHIRQEWDRVTITFHVVPPYRYIYLPVVYKNYSHLP